MIDFMYETKKVTKEEVDLWEKENNISLPDDYKNFLINIGAGFTKVYHEDLTAVYIKKTDTESAEAGVYEFHKFFELHEIIKENYRLDNYNPHDSSFLIFLREGNYCFYLMCIDNNSENYGKIYYNKSGHHPPFLAFQGNDEYQYLPLLENNFQDFIENIELVE